jgi:hypothetical protein
MTEDVKILFSPGYGSGWYSSNTQYPELLRNERVIQWVEDGQDSDERVELVSYLETKYPDMYIGSNLDDLEIALIPKGTLFRIKEYNGYERIELRDKVDWHIA